MAMIDYGCVVKRNGKIINANNSTMDMKEILGFAIDYNIPSTDGTTNINPNDDFIGYIGDRNYFIGVYKTSVYLFTFDGDGYRYEAINDDKEYVVHSLNTNYSYHLWSIGDDAERRKMIKLNTPNAQWEILFGYGIDCNYDIQMKYAFQYGISAQEIEYIAKFWGQFVYVSGLKCKYNRKTQTITRYYKYTKMKGNYYIGITFEDDVTGGRCMKMWGYKSKELSKLIEDLDNLPLSIKRFITGVSLTEPEVHLYAFCYHRTVNDETHSSSEKWDDDNFYCRVYTRKEINNWRD